MVESVCVFVLKKEAGATFPFTACQSIKTQATAVRPISQHRKVQDPATEPLSLQPSLIRSL